MMQVFNDGRVEAVETWLDYYPVRAEVWRYHQRDADEEFMTLDEAASAAAYACDMNTAYYERAKDLRTGEVWERQRLLDVGWGHAPE